MLGLASLGCGQAEIGTEYGERKGFQPTSVNGTAVFGEMFQRAGHNVFSWRLLSPRLRERADAIVWFPDDFDPPKDEVRKWLDEWLAAKPGRTLIYVGRDFDAAPWYYQKVAPLAPADQQSELRSRGRRAQRAFDARRGKLPASKDADWFTLRGDAKPRTVRTLQGDPEWTASVDAKKLEIRLHSRLEPSPDADVVLESEDDALISVLPIGQGQLILVANGSFLLNGPLVNHQHRKLAGTLVSQVGPPPKTVVFLESNPGGPTIADKDPKLAFPSPMEVFHVWPANWILLQLLIVGVLFCFFRYPLFGRPREPEPDRPSDFGKHIDALGMLLAKTADRRYAMSRLIHYQQTVRSESAPRDERKIAN